MISSLRCRGVGASAVSTESVRGCTRDASLTLQEQAHFLESLLNSVCNLLGFWRTIYYQAADQVRDVPGTFTILAPKAGRMLALPGLSPRKLL